MNFQQVDQQRKSVGLSPYAMCRRAGVAPSIYYRARKGGGVRAATLRRWQAALSGSTARPPAPLNPDLIRATYRGYMLAVARHFFPDLPADAAAIEALSHRPARKAQQDARWRAAARAREIAVYCSVTELGLRGKQVAEAIGVTRAAVSTMLRRVEDAREDPAVDAMIARAAAVISGGPGDES